MIQSHKIKSRMYELQITQDAIAKQMGLNITTLGLKINGKRRIYIDEVAKLCKILHITTSAELKEYFGLDFLIIKKCENETRKDLESA